MTQGGTTKESYSYDAVGNRTGSLGVSSYTTNSSNEMTANSNVSYTYDYSGNTTSKTDSIGTTDYSWDYENRMTSVTLPASAESVTFKYDPFGRRIEKVSPTTTSIFAYDGDNLVETTNGSGSEIASYTQSQNIDEPLAMLRGTTKSFYEADGLGSITSLSNSSGSLAHKPTRTIRSETKRRPLAHLRTFCGTRGGSSIQRPVSITIALDITTRRRGDSCPRTRLA